MIKWPLPNLDNREFFELFDLDTRNWRSPKQEYDNNYNQIAPWEKEFLKGWGNPWPDLPSPDEDSANIDLSSIRLSIPKNRCESRSLLGYYLSWHIVGVSFENENGRVPYDGDELKVYNDSLPEENRFGIHICTSSIDTYIDKFSTEGLEPAEVANYKEFCAYLTLIYVIAHEWGHYRSEVLSFQLGNLSEAVTGEVKNNYRPSYLSYFINKKRFPDTNFEEVFAEWAALKLGIFNYFMKPPSFAVHLKNWPLIEATVKYMLAEVMSRPSRKRPYSDIRHWIDFQSITENVILKRYSENKSSINRAVNDNVKIDGIRSLFNGKIIDLLVHNQMQFSQNHRFNGVVRSSPNIYPKKPDSVYYNFGYDGCEDGHKVAKSENFLRLNLPNQTNNYSFVYQVVSDLQDHKKGLVFLPIKVFPSVLPLDPVYFH
jgi:hypothetical protein